MGCASVSPAHLAIIFNVKEFLQQEKKDVHYRVKLKLNSPRAFPRRGCRPRTLLQELVKGFPFMSLSEKGFVCDGSRCQEQALGKVALLEVGGAQRRGILSDKLPPGSSLTAEPAPGQHSKGGRLPPASPQAPTGGQAGAGAVHKGRGAGNIPECSSLVWR